MSSKVPLADVEKHIAPDDCWIVVNGKVYDLTSFAPNHPGGSEIIFTWAGRDASQIYNTYHTANLIESELPESDKKGDFDESTATEAWLKARTQRAAMSSSTDDWPPLSSIINLHDFEKAFAAFGPAKAYAYTDGASNDLHTYRANALYWQKVWFRPRILRNVARVNTRTKILGNDVSMPVWICPMGIAKTAGPEGEAALGRGASASGIIHCIPITASLPTEEIVASAPSAAWFFQVYVDKQRHKTEALLRKISAMPHIKAVFVTVDLSVVSKREADERLKSQEIAPAYASGQPSGAGRGSTGLAKSTGSYIDPALSWDDVAWIRRHTHLPLVLKGIQSAADALRAMHLGCAGIVVSNHGGRALDNAPATVAVLLELRRDCPEVFEKMEVLIDGGVRRGSDVLKAICLGAKGVGVGRPFQYSVAYGTEGVRHCAASKS